MRDKNGVDSDGRGSKDERGMIDRGETVFILYCIRKKLCKKGKPKIK